MTKDLWVHCPSSMFSNICIVLYFYTLSHLLFSSLNPVSTNLIHNLKRSLIYELSLLTLFSVVMLCLWQLPVLLCKFPVSLVCYQVPLLSLEWPCFFLYSFCANISHLLTIWDIVFFFLPHILKVMIGLFYLSFVSHSLYELPALAHHITWLPFELSIRLFSVNSCFFFFICCFWHFVFTKFPCIISFFHGSSFSLCNSVWIPSYSLYRCILLFIQWLKWILDIPSQLSFSILIVLSQLINPLPPISLLRCTLST